MSYRTIIISRTALMLILISTQVLTLNAQSTPTGKDMGASPCYSCPKVSNTQPATNNTNNTTQQSSGADLAQQQLFNEAHAANVKGIDYYNKQDWANAVTAFQEAVDKNPGNQTMKDNLYKAKQQLLARQQQQLRIQQNNAAVLKMQQSVQAFTQTLKTVSSNGGLNFNGQNPTASFGNNNTGNGLTFIPATSAPGTISSTTNGLQFGDPSVMNTQHVPSGLKKETDDAITGAYKNAPPGVSDRVRKGFQAIATNDWKVARAWFQDALLLDPGNQGLQKFIVLCDYTPAGTTQPNRVVNTNTTSNHNLNIPTQDEVDKIFADIPNEAEVKEWFRKFNEAKPPTEEERKEYYSPQAVKMRNYIHSLTSDEFGRLLNANLTNKQLNELMFEYLIDASEKKLPLNTIHQ